MKTSKPKTNTPAGSGRLLPLVLPYATPPGDTLRETLKAKGITQKLLAETMGRPMKTISEIIHAKARITEHTALELEHALGIPANLWMALETNYRIALARGQNKELSR
ncbi:VapI Plasmid maintenance system antidote protein [uncultured Caudovirales phage]|uniref:VapI Plasmid maintenance system antidote protein n=1 Tax=uncultured Caudovirales phage TaxID=2100421 RepID=A0A6J5P659_9CAUD|nr:VapI Plasmid maintenance system antidote protein [uncultured Caudovirales phage]